MARDSGLPAEGEKSEGPRGRGALNAFLDIGSIILHVKATVLMCAMLLNIVESDAVNCREKAGVAQKQPNSHQYLDLEILTVSYCGMQFLLLSPGKLSKTSNFSP